MAYRSSEKTRQKKDAKRTAMMQAAMKVFAEKGYHAATVRDVVKQADVAIGTFYFYFPDKETLFTYLYEETADFILQSLQQATSGSADFETKLKATMQSYLNIAAYEPAVIQLLLVGGVGAVPSLHEKRIQFRERLAGAWQRLLREGHEQGVLATPQDLRRSAEYIAGGIDEIVLTLLRLPNPNTDVATAELIQTTLRLVGYQAAE